MAYLALYRKYRPEKFDDVVGQDKIVNVISNAILTNKISHAYLFSGPRGTGKTTTAKIIARMVNCKELKNGMPCGICDNCINFVSSNDVVEIDAASNNGVDEIRELRDKVNLVPTNSRYKIYIIDEVHMLTTQAFNALLKSASTISNEKIFDSFIIPLDMFLVFSYSIALTTSAAVLDTLKSLAFSVISLAAFAKYGLSLISKSSLLVSILIKLATASL